MRSFQGHLLVAASHQRDPSFMETVILVVEHSALGAFGVILNCPRELSKFVLLGMQCWLSSYREEQ